MEKILNKIDYLTTILQFTGINKDYNEQSAESKNKRWLFRTTNGCTFTGTKRKN